MPQKKARGTALSEKGWEKKNRKRGEKRKGWKKPQKNKETIAYNCQDGVCNHP